MLRDSGWTFGISSVGTVAREKRRNSDSASSEFSDGSIWSRVCLLPWYQVRVLPSPLSPKIIMNLWHDGMMAAYLGPWCIHWWIVRLSTCRVPQLMSPGKVHGWRPFPSQPQVRERYFRRVISDKGVGIKHVISGRCHVAYLISQVPPPTLLLFGSGRFGMIGIARRKNAA
jgi:hypothetical protein